MNAHQLDCRFTNTLFCFLCQGSILLVFSFVISGSSARAKEHLGPCNEPVDLTLYHQVYYVAQSGKDQVERGTRAQPYRTVAFALAQSQVTSENSHKAILVAAGTFVVSNLQLFSRVDLYGGFDEKDWIRQIVVNKTILAGCSRRRLLNGADQCRLDGFTLRGGRCRGHGGAILCEDAGMVIRNNTFIDNGTLEPTGYNRQHVHQRAHTGGAISMCFASPCEIAHNLFVENFTELGDGGAISCYEMDRSPHKKCVIQANVFLGNRTGVAVMAPPWTRASNGGAIACSHSSAPDILKNTFIGNWVGDNSDAGAIYLEMASSPLIQKNWIVGNHSYDDGGGIYCMRDSQPIIENNWIAGNSCVRGGPGGVRLSKQGRAIVRNNFLVHNQSGGGMISVASWLRLENNTIVNNEDGGVTHINSLAHFAPSILSRNIIRGNSLEVAEGGLQPVISHNNIEGGFAGEGNVDTDPQFIEDGIEGTVLHIQYSPDSFTTWIGCEQISAGNADFNGRVLQYGNRWSVVYASEENFESKSYISVWGDMTQQMSGHANASDSFRILPTFRPKENTPYHNMGAR